MPDEPTPGQRAEAGFRVQLEDERRRLAGILDVDWQDVDGDTLICPICGVLVRASRQAQHRDWHLRNLQ